MQTTAAQCYWRVLTGMVLALGLAGPSQAKQDDRQIELEVALGTPVMLAGQTQTAYLKVGLLGFELTQDVPRTPANVAIVLDKSGSMQGEKIARARDAANLAISKLGRDDIAAIVSYDNVVRVDMPATRVSDKDEFRRRINAIAANGNTALFAGVSKGAHEVRKFLDPNRVNRVILLSDGLANVGPSSPYELGQLGAALARENISVSTIGLGLGYNEDLMTQLAGMSDGNHAFAENADDLARIFTAEFGDVLSVIAQDVQIRIRCADGVRPLRVLGRESTIDGQDVIVNLHQIYGQQEKFVVLEIEVAAAEANEQRDLAWVDVGYQNTITRQADQLRGSVSVAFSGSATAVKESADDEVMTDTVSQIANEMSKRALELRDEGRVEEAQQQLKESAAYLRSNAAEYRSDKLEQLGAEFEQDADALEDSADWNRTRKALKKKQYSLEKQQRY